MKQYLDRAILVAVLCVMAALGIWMQISLLEPVTTETVSGPGREPDYYIQNFTAKVPATIIGDYNPSTGYSGRDSSSSGRST